ncbi:unnamed protein product [Moneuplotes crassus]|uniref:Uncharacterized protein n=2 Tax=Euplotes crassus TaxID=5936 RepID=A0AAD1UB88_EUPCR|nr:unnamed protein product [Moneuplotes crassus]
MEKVNSKAMRDLFKVTKDNKILDQILKKQQRRGYRTFADPTIWKSKEEIISGQGTVSATRYNNYEAKILPYASRNSRKSLNSKAKGINHIESSSNGSSSKMAKRMTTCGTHHKAKSIPANNENKVVRLNHKSPKLKEFSEAEVGKHWNRSSVGKVKNDLSFIEEKSNEKPVIKGSYIKITRNKKNKIITSKTNKIELNSKLEKALNEFDDCKDQYNQHLDSPLKPPEAFNTIYSPENRLKSAPYQPGNTFMSTLYSPKTASNFNPLYNKGPGSPIPNDHQGNFELTIDVNGVPHSVKMNGTEATDESNAHAKEAAELKEKLFVSEILLKKLYCQNQELVEKTKKQQEKIMKMDNDYRNLQKQHLLLQHNIQNKVMATRKSNFSINTLGFKSPIRRNSFDKFIEMQGINDEANSFWSELKQSTQHLFNTESMDEDLEKKMNSVFQSQRCDSPNGYLIARTSVDKGERLIKYCIG